MIGLESFFLVDNVVGGIVGVFMGDCSIGEVGVIIL